MSVPVFTYETILQYVKCMQTVAGLYERENVPCSMCDKLVVLKTTNVKR